MSVENVRIVVCGAMYGGNVGSICRAMSNMGLADLALVAPAQLDMAEARMMACHAADILRNMKEYPDLGRAIADCGFVAGATGRGGLYRRHATTPREIAPRVLEAVCGGGRAALVFGREDNGLSNEELALCTHVVRIPTGPRKSLNVSQAVMICCYELLMAEGSYERPREKSEAASSELRERMFGMWRDAMLKTGFSEEMKADHMMFGLRRILARGVLTVNDATIMTGLARQAIWCADQIGRGAVRSVKTGARKSDRAKRS